MGSRIESKFKECLHQKKINRFPGVKSLVSKEMRVALSDLRTARAGLGEKRWKWSTIQAYYSMFHAARALIYSKGYREKSHYCLRVALELLFVEPDSLDEKHIEAFQVGKVMRENADYEEEFTANGAKKIVDAASEFLKAAKSILR